MGRMAVFVLVAFLAAGCGLAAMNMPAGEEMFPPRNADAQIGLLINEGTTSLNVWILDQANRLIEEIYLPPAEQFYTFNGRRNPTVVVKALPPGSYRIEYIPFFYHTQVLGLVRERVDLPRGSAGITVGRDAFAFYDRDTGRHWGWILRLNGGSAPLPAPIPRVRINCNWPILCQ